ncbi:methyltransferase, FxLD system [Streptomyces sp. NA02950]|uniref:methyltransferase, FxLD system n=1 Tax=Streptomyces sp. NA02950 TaxID=2742137 RepID=UPI0015902D1A|nr:methyltransferase, FxLD system [Streptomyces sp. NA02950]QKV95260.1 methyltransferase, FxLD system [Streptomyces sp. NA02950]
MTDVTVNPDEANQLRDKVVDQLKEDGTIVSPGVEAAMRKVPRHLAVPDAPLDEAYSTYDAVVTKRSENGTSMSSVSAPQVQAMQLEQADLRPGNNVVEYGTNGPNAAYIAELVGDTGQVTTVDIDADAAARATRFLAETGYSSVRVLTADASGGVPEYAPYDAVVVTVGAWDIPPAWREQLTEGGRLVVPLRIRNLTRTYGFVRQGDHLVSSSAHVCGFVPMQGEDAHEEQLLSLGDGVSLRFDDGPTVDPSPLDGVLRTPRAETWTGVTVGRTENIGTLQMYLATMAPGFCIMSVDLDSNTAVVEPSNKGFSLAAVRGPNFAYVLVRRTPDDKNVEYGVHAFGPDGASFADEVADCIRAWGKEHRGGPGPRVAIYPVGTPDDQIPGDRVIDKRHSRISVSWSAA